MPTCLECSKENPDEARFCLACGSPFAPAAPERRKLATLLFCDMSGSTAMGERVDAESVREMMFRYFHTMREAIERHGGTVEKFIGDAVMAVFGLPVAHEDDALRAVRASAEMQERLQELNPELERRFGSTIALRIGLNTGEVVAGDATTRQTLVTGDAVNVAARLEQAAAPGEVLLGEPTYRLCRDAVTVEPVEPLTLKGKSEPLPAYRLLAVVPGAPGHARRLEAPMVAREEELALLAGAFAEAVQTRSCRLVTVVGEPGVGKSRLAAELLSALAGQATILQGRCLSYGEGITFWPIGEIVREAAAIHDEHTPTEARERIASLLAGEEQADLVATRVAQAIGLEGGGAAAEEIAWAIRKLFEALARSRPLLLLVDDIHWAESALLDLLAQLPTLTREAPILLLCLARPELLEERPEWEAQGRLEPLPESDSERLLENLLGNLTIAPAVRERIAGAAGGNPLFVEELVAMLVEDGLLRRENGSWLATRELAEITIPTTLGALLGARLDQLGHERAALERGAIEGQVFHRGAVAALSSPDAQAALAPRLATLVAKELLRPAEASFADEAAFRFRHILIRDAAYQATPKKLRAELHERFADWLGRAAGERVAEYEEILGYHLEQACGYLQELGPVDERGRELAKRAGEWLTRAGRRALGRGDVHAAVNLLGRARLLLPNAPARGEISPEFAEALIELGELSEAEQVVGESLAEARAASDRRAEEYLLIVSLHLELLTDSQGDLDEWRQKAERSARFFLGRDEDLGVAQALRLLGMIENFKGRSHASREVLERALAYAVRLDDEREETWIRHWIDASLAYGPSHVGEDASYARNTLDWANRHGNQQAKAQALAFLAMATARQGEFRDARELVAQSRSILEDLAVHEIGFCSYVAGVVELLAGDPAAAEREWHAGFEVASQAGDTNVALFAPLLAEALFEQQRYAEAESFAEIGEETAATVDVSSQVLRATIRAKLAARRSEGNEAERSARRAVELARSTDDVDLIADTLVALAAVLKIGDRIPDASLALEEALRLYDQKGNVVSAERARDALTELQTPANMSPQDGRFIPVDPQQVERSD